MLYDWHTVTEGQRDSLDARLYAKGINHAPSWIPNKRILYRQGVEIGLMSASEVRQLLKEWKL